MTNRKAQRQIERAELIQSVDDARDPAHPFKLSTGLRSLVDTRLTDLRAKDAATHIEEGDRATASRNVRAALDRLKDHLRDGYNFIKGLGKYEISNANRLGLFTTYGWSQGEIGELTDERTEALANQAITATPTIANPDYRYPAALMTLITDDLAIVNANQPLATTGDRQAAIDARNEATELLRKANSRVRFFYSSASDDTDFTPELAKIGFQPRRLPGEAQQQQPPGDPGEVTFDPEALTLSVAQMPPRATSIRSYRRAAGGEAELAGQNNGTTVTVVEPGPLTPGVDYEFWLVGLNSAGEGPESAHITYTVAVPA